VFSTWRNIYICAELCRESGAGIGNAFLHYGYGKGDCCFRNREKRCSRTGGIRGVCLSSGRTESGIHKPQRGIRYQFSERKDGGLWRNFCLSGAGRRRCDRISSFCQTGAAKRHFRRNLSETGSVRGCISWESDGNVVIKRKSASYNSLRKTGQGGCDESKRTKIGGHADLSGTSGILHRYGNPASGAGGAAL